MHSRSGQDCPVPASVAEPPLLIAVARGSISARVRPRRPARPARWRRGGRASISARRWRRGGPPAGRSSYGQPSRAVPQHEERSSSARSSRSSASQREPVAAAQLPSARTATNVRIAQNAELMRDGGLADAELRTELLDDAPHRQFAARQELDDAQTDRVAEQREEVHRATLGPRTPSRPRSIHRSPGDRQRLALLVAGRALDADGRALVEGGQVGGARVGERAAQTRR